MTQLAIFCGLRLARPVGVDWFRQLKHAKLMNLKPGNLVWYIVDGDIECAEVTQPSQAFHDRKQHGVQVFCSSKTRIWSPCLIMDKEPGIFHMITDREAAFEYYDKHSGNSDEGRDVKLHIVGGSG
jgi:hypothetical protein